MPRQTIYTQDSDLDGLTDAQEMALGTNPLSLIQMVMVKLTWWKSYQVAKPRLMR